MKAFFTAIEGGDVCGKGTQVKFLADHLEAKKFKFPDKDTPIGKIIYEHLFRKWHVVSRAGGADMTLEEVEHIDAQMFQCLQLANRLEHAQEIAETLHMRNQCVVADRYSASGIVYGANDGLDPVYWRKNQEWLPKPDLNILLDIDVETALGRMKSRGDTPDRYENEETISKIVARYRKHWVEMRAYEGDHRWIVIDGRPPEIEVAAEIASAVKTYRAEAA